MRMANLHVLCSKIDLIILCFIFISYHVVTIWTHCSITLSCWRSEKCYKNWALSKTLHMQPVKIL